MTVEELLIKTAENETKCAVTWKGHALFYADTDGNIAENGAFICQAGYTFYVSDGSFTTSFFAPDINFKDISKKQDALAYVRKQVSKLKYTSPVVQLFGDAVTVFEFDGDRKIFVKIKGSELVQLVDMAISKQKYSLTEYKKIH